MEIQGYIYEFITTSLKKVKLTKKDKILNIFDNLSSDTKYVLKKKNKRSILVIIPQNKTSIYIIEES